MANGRRAAGFFDGLFQQLASAVFVAFLKFQQARRG